MKKTISLLGSFLLLFMINTAFSQVTVWTEDFEATTGNGGYNGANGNWTVSNQGVNGPQAGKWRVDDTECGGAPGDCGSAGCGDQSLFMGTSDAIYGAGFTGAALLADPQGETNKRIESPVIDCSAHTSITITFNYIEGRAGDPGIDIGEDATLWYFDGTTWAQIDPLALTPNTCDPQGTWTEFTTFNLPASADNNANVQIGFQWTADSDADGIDPSFAVDDILIAGSASATPTITADFTQDLPTTVCEGATVTFTDASVASNTTITSWDWTFNGGDVTTASTQGPHSITFNTAGNYNIELTAGDGAISDTEVISIIVSGPPTVTASAAPSTSICTGDPVTLSGGGATNYTWTNGANDGVSFTPSIGSTTYTVTGTDGNGCSNTADVTIDVADCLPMIAGFSFADNICVGSCINFTDTTSGAPVAWSWDFSAGASTLTSTDQNPESICFNTAGVYSIQLTVTDAGGTSVSTTNSITVHESPTVTAQLDTIIDLGGQAELIATSPDLGTYLWTPDIYYIECDTCSSTIAQPQLSTDYYVTFTSPNGCTAEDTVKVDVNFIEGIGVPQAFSPNGDGQNDQLVVKGYGINRMNFKVYNRYGQLVFESEIQDHGWDGTFKGKDENPGVFVWVLEYTLLNGSTGLLKGNTTLIR